MKSFTLIICFLFACLSFAQEDEKDKTFDLIDLITIDNESYRFKIQSDGKTFKMKTCLETEDCKDAFEFIKTMNEDAFLSAVITQINSEHNKTLTLSDLTPNKADESIKKLLDKVKAYDERKAREDLSEAQNILRDIDKAKDEYSGELKLHDSIENFKLKEPSDGDIERYFSYIYERENPEDDYELKADIDYDSLTLELVDATVTFFNNKASSIAVNAKLKQGDTVIEDLEFYNHRYSIPVRAFTYYDNASDLIRVKYVLTADTKTGHTIEIHANDIFDYKSFGKGKVGNFGFSIANQRVHVSNEISKSEPKKSNTAKIVQRRFFDFFTGVIYSDLLGLNTDTSNSLVNAQASILMPMNLGNWSEWTALKQFKLNFNIALNNSFENEERFIGFKNTDKVNHFDLYRKNNLNSTLSLDLMSYESKGWFLTWSLGYNVGFYRTGYQYTKTVTGAADEVTTGQLLSISHGPYLNFEFRPQNNFGADISISLDEFNLNDDDIINDISLRNDLIQNNKSESFLFKHNMVNVSAKFYWLTNPGKSNGGVYANAGLAYHTPTRASFPQLMVGYATNLTSFVNRFNQKETPEPKKEE